MGSMWRPSTQLQVVYTERIFQSSLWLLFSERHTTVHKRRQGSGFQGKSQIRQSFLLFFIASPFVLGGIHDFSAGAVSHADFG